GAAMELISSFIIYPDVLRRVQMPVRVTSDPAGASVLIDGKPTGVRTPGWVTYRPREGALVTVTKKGYSNAEKRIPAIRSKDKTKVLKSLKEYASIDCSLSKELTSGQTLDGAVEARPVVDGGNIYLATRAGKVFRLKAEKHQAVEVFQAESIGGIKASPAIDDGRLFMVTLEGTLSRLDPKDGKLTVVWTKELGSMVTASLAISGKTLIVGDALGRISAFDTESGELLGRQDAGGEIRSRSVVVDGKVYAVTSEGVLRIFKLEGLEPQPDAEAKYEDLKLSGSPVVHDGRLYLRGTNGSLHAVELETGKRLWECRFGSELRCPPVIIGDVAIVSTLDGKLQAVKDGKVVATYELGGSITSGAASKGDLIFVCNNTGRCAALRFGKGAFRLRWKIDLSSKDEERPLRILVAPVVAKDLVIIAAESGEVFVLSE
ncbi:MAG: outer membrane protein assembly factor BamB family protein, partial [Planctomycetota bacterium]